MSPRIKKLGRSRTQRTPKQTKAPGKILDRLSPDELAAVLRRLLEKRPALVEEAEKIAARIISLPSVDDIADKVFLAVTSLDMDDLHGRAGRHSWGYVEPSEAARELLEEAVQDVFDDMKRRRDLGFEAAAEAVCCGIIFGLSRVDDKKPKGLLKWAVDFPAEHAYFTITELIGMYPASKRRGVRDRLSATLNRLAPKWPEMISRTVRESADD
jgi:hypothetical protein